MYFFQYICFVLMAKRCLNGNIYLVHSLVEIFFILYAFQP